MKLLRGLLVLSVGILLGTGGMYYYNEMNDQNDTITECFIDKSNEVAGVYFQKVGIDENNETQIEFLLQYYGLKNRNVIIKESNTISVPNMLAYIYSEKEISNIYLYNIDSEVFASLDYNYIDYMNQTQNPILLAMNLKEDEVLVVKVLETESVPAALLRFDIDDVPYYWVIQYDGRGDRMLIEDIKRVE